MYYQRTRGLRIKDFWFVNDRERDLEPGADFAQYHDMPAVPGDTQNMMVQNQRLTLVNDLTETEEELMARFKKNTKYEIKRAAKEGSYAEFLSGAALLEKKEILARIDKAHAQMFADKGKKSKREYPTMLAAAKANMLTVTVGYLPDGRECAYHVYIVGNGTARLLHSISVFREATTNEDRNAIGRLNRFLHYADMQHLKQGGYTVYDWGGYSEEEQLKSISDFKKAFGGEITEIYTVIYATSPVGKLLSKLVKWVKFRGK